MKIKVGILSGKSATLTRNSCTYVSRMFRKVFFRGIIFLIKYFYPCSLIKYFHFIWTYSSAKADIWIPNKLSMIFPFFKRNIEIMRYTLCKRFTNATYNLPSCQSYRDILAFSPLSESYFTTTRLDPSARFARARKAGKSNYPVFPDAHSRIFSSSVPWREP